MSVKDQPSTVPANGAAAVGEGPVSWHSFPRPWFGIPYPPDQPEPLSEPTVETQAAALRVAIRNHLRYTLAKYQARATPRNYYEALVLTLRNLLTDAWIQTQKDYYDRDAKRVYYLSAEYMIGRHLDTVLVNLQLEEACRLALSSLGTCLPDITEQEWDAGLGTGGLGRLAACLLDSMASLGVPAYGYGIRYEYGIFRQKIENGRQVETADNWLRYGNPWEIPRPEFIYPVRFYGRPHTYTDERGRTRTELLDSQLVIAMAHDIPIPGYGNGVVNTLRLWAAKSSREFDLEYFNDGDYNRAVEDKNRTENISRVLYPRDDIFPGRELRLKQEYFLVSASLQDILRRYQNCHNTLDALPQKAAIQLNDTHPALAIPELMRLLIDEHGLSWEQAWILSRASLGFTNHTLMPEALERWPVEVMGHVLPRILQIIFEINARFLVEVSARFPGDPERLRRMSLIEEGEEKRVRMANLAVVGSHAVNGVSGLHSQLLSQQAFRDFFELYPERFSNKTNGVTPRLWLGRANPALAQLLTRHLGDRWITHLEDLEALEPLADDAAFRREWAKVKRGNKQRLAGSIAAGQGIVLDCDSLFDCQIKRIHEYKRQLLNLLHVIVRYNQLRDGADAGLPRSVIFAGKAAPAYWMAKKIIHLIHAVAGVVNRDPKLAGRLKVVFVPNYGVSAAELIIPAADLSEQISTAGSEASGTSNMKLALNGALTVGTLDGANIEIRSAVGAENFFLFGLDTAQVQEHIRSGYKPRDYYLQNPALARALDMIRDGFFSPEQPDVFQPIVDALLRPGEPFMVLADFSSYVECQERIRALYAEPDAWARKSILNVARMGYFSSDRTIREYARDIWSVSV
jgi:starch phosphorylase